MPMNVLEPEVAKRVPHRRDVARVRVVGVDDRAAGGGISVRVQQGA
jgi:hypothetical protein